MLIYFHFILLQNIVLLIGFFVSIIYELFLSKRVPPEYRYQHRILVFRPVTLGQYFTFSEDIYPFITIHINSLD